MVTTQALETAEASARASAIHEGHERCTYRTCRHSHDLHGKTWKKANGKKTGCKCKHFTPANKPQRFEPVEKNEEFLALEKLLNENDIKCRWCENDLSSFDIQQDKITAADGKPDVNTFVHCVRCKYDWAAWKLLNQHRPFTLSDAPEGAVPPSV